MLSTDLVKKDQLGLVPSIIRSTWKNRNNASDPIKEAREFNHALLVLLVAGLVSIMGMTQSPASVPPGKIDALWAVSQITSLVIILFWVVLSLAELTRILIRTLRGQPTFRTFTDDLEEVEMILEGRGEIPLREMSWRELEEKSKNFLVKNALAVLRCCLDKETPYFAKKDMIEQFETNYKLLFRLGLNNHVPQFYQGEAQRILDMEKVEEPAGPKLADQAEDIVPDQVQTA